MEAYTGFAELYDQFMNNVPYDAWEALLAAILKEEGVTEGLVLELGCGTGIMTERLANRGYDMIGVDLSEDMLAEAMEKRCESGNNILYLNQDMREFELYGTVAAIYSICDSLNYLTEDGDLTTVFRLANNYLDPRGVMIFDFNTPAEYRSPLRQHPIVEVQGDVTMIWENCFEEETQINEHHVVFFLPAEEEEEDYSWMEEKGELNRNDLPLHAGEVLYQKVEEVHEQRAYTLAEVINALTEAGMEFVRAMDAVTGGPVTEKTGRVLCVAREKYTEGKQYIGFDAE